MVIIQYSPANTKFITRSFLENLYIFPSFIFGISSSNFNNINNIILFFKEFILSLFNLSYNLNNDIIFNNIKIQYITNTLESVNYIINNKIKYNITKYPSNSIYNENFNLNINTFILSDKYNSSIATKINQFKSIIIINTNYGNLSNYDILSVYLMLFKHTTLSEKGIFNNKNLNFNYLDIR